jgi:hypothetical protein
MVRARLSWDYGMAGMLSPIDLGLLCVSGLGVTVWRCRPCFFEGPNGVAIASGGD